MDIADLKNRFAYHAPKDEDTKIKHETIRDMCFVLAQNFNNLCPEGQEKSLAVTKVEEAMMWANAAIARQ